MTEEPPSGPQVPSQRPDPKAAARPSKGEDRPGFRRESVEDNVEDLSIDRPRLTPQERSSTDGERQDSTNPMGEGAKQGQGDQAEG